MSISPQKSTSQSLPAQRGPGSRRELRDPLQTVPCNVLIVDDSLDSIDVLQTALQRRGVSTLATRHPTEGLDLARDFHPDVILLDLESVEGRASDAIRDNYDQAAKRENAPLILVARSSGHSATQHGTHVVSKPYHYAPLIRKIQELLEPANQNRAA